MSRPIRSFLDSGVLIEANATTGELAAVALHLLAAPGRVFVTSRLLQLEVEPKARYERRFRELKMLGRFFDATAEHVPITEALVSLALECAGREKMKAMDSLHVAAAIIGRCDELITTEVGPQGIHRARGIRVVDLRTLASA